MDVVKYMYNDFYLFRRIVVFKRKCGHLDLLVRLIES